MKITGLFRVIIFARDLEAMIRFYRDDLGLPIIADRRGEGWVVFSVGGQSQIALHGGAGEHRPEWAPKAVLGCADPAAFHKYLSSRGVLVGDLQEWEGTQSFDCSDPEGNDLQIASIRPM